MFSIHLKQKKREKFMIEVKQVTSKKDWKIFATFAINLYKDNPHYVPVFISDDKNIANPKKNPSAQNTIVKAFLAYKDGKVVGRIAGVILKDSPLEEDKKLVRFSRFDVIDDFEVTKALFNKLEEFAKENGKEGIHGPWGFNDTDREGLLTSGFDEDGSYATIYNHAYYNEHLIKMGYEKESGWIETEVKLPGKGEHNYDRYVKLGSYVKKRYKLTEACEKMPLKKVIKTYGDSFFECYNEAYNALDMFVEINPDTKKQVLAQFAVMINKEYFSVILDENEKVVAFCVLLPSFGKLLKKHGGKMSLPFILELAKYLKKPDVLELTLIAVRPEFLKMGYTAACIKRIIENVDKNKVKKIVCLPTLESNTAVRSQWSALEHKDTKTRQTYIKKI